MAKELLKEDSENKEEAGEKSTETHSFKERIYAYSILTLAAFGIALIGPGNIQNEVIDLESFNKVFLYLVLSVGSPLWIISLFCLSRSFFLAMSEKRLTRLHLKEAIRKGFSVKDTCSQKVRDVIEKIKGAI